MSHTCVDFTCLPSGILIVKGFFASKLFLALTPSMTKIDVTPLSAIAIYVAIVSAFKYCGIGLPYTALAAAVIDVTCLGGCLFIDLFDVITVTSSSSETSSLLKHWVGFRELAETKLLHLCAILFSAPHHQKLGLTLGDCVLCIALVHGSYPALIHCNAFLRVKPTRWFIFRQCVGHVWDVCPSLMPNPHEKHLERRGSNLRLRCPYG